MSIALLIPTRGRPEMLWSNVCANLRNARLSDTRIVVGIDQDERDRYVAGRPQLGGVVLSIADREESIGAKWNRCARAAAQFDPSLILVGADDVHMATPGWDERAAQAEQVLTDGLGVVDLGEIGNVMQIIGVTSRTLEIMGDLVSEHFPVWWGDTWLFEIGAMIGRIVKVPVELAHSHRVEGNTRGIRDVQFWAALFDKLRPERERIAERIVTSPGYSSLLTMQMRMVSLRDSFRKMHEPTLDTDKAADLERKLSFDAANDERYSRLKARADEMMKAFASTPNEKAAA